MKTVKSHTRITPFGKVENAILVVIQESIEGGGMVVSKEQIGEELKLDDEGDELAI